jgi:DNA-binding NarL/FixJ family response regulator
VIRVLLADDDLLRAGVTMLLESADDIEVVGEAATGREAVELTQRLVPDVVLMDIQMPDLDGIAATRTIAASPGARSRVIVVTTFELDEYVFESLRAGASGFLMKRATPDELIDAIRLVNAGEALLAPSVTRRLIERFTDQPTIDAETSKRAESLTDREREVLIHVGHGLNNTEIAKALHISESTAKTHLQRVLMKLHLRDRVGAAVFAYEAGLIRPGENPPPLAMP